MTLDNYPGAKSGSGIQQWLINQIPAHDRYFELFAGSAQLFRAKQAAKVSILADIDKEVCALLKEAHIGSEVTILNQCAVEILRDYNGGNRYKPIEECFTGDDFIYLDPPYPASARRNGRTYYKHEMLSENDHVNLLAHIECLDANVMISTRQNDLYDEMLNPTFWRKDTFQTMDRAGKCEEVIYMNYAVPEMLHQYNYLGKDYTDRQRVKRKIERFSAKIAMLPVHEKHLFIQELILNDKAAVQHILSMLTGK